MQSPVPAHDDDFRFRSAAKRRRRAFSLHRADGLVRLRNRRFRRRLRRLRRAAIRFPRQRRRKFARFARPGSGMYDIFRTAAFQNPDKRTQLSFRLLSPRRRIDDNMIHFNLSLCTFCQKNEKFRAFFENRTDILYNTFRGIAIYFEIWYTGIVIFFEEFCL